MGVSPVAVVLDGAGPRAGRPCHPMRNLYIILSVVGWAWCLPVAAFLWVRLRRRPPSHRDVTEDAAVFGASRGRPEADV